jgi:hypothetical protein
MASLSSAGLLPKWAQPKAISLTQTPVRPNRRYSIVPRPSALMDLSGALAKFNSLHKERF